MNPTWQQSGSYHHAAGNSFFLWEGNDGPGLMADDIHGSSHFITAFRNVWLGWEPGKTQETIPIHLEAYNRYYNFVGRPDPRGGPRHRGPPSDPTSAAARIPRDTHTESPLTRATTTRRRPVAS